ncbi:tetraacyldisaccharide 4'-kinase [uncultured Psychroserpens sp.]|uniref:tetraacyldisaccharide 4'-kinase n=1 Tax=uncultured Psychroserpens sp. TaxID=255436 RepID=UPI002638C291|nr:tetraacyldisaccharide 4'-kinase [uncultured Psychroserpens sp.]
MKLLRKILFPIVPIYYIVTWLRNKLYDLGWKSSYTYELPIICVGNLSVGGTGKTPTIEYLIRLLKDNYKVATLSRGYKRESSGFIIANEAASAKTIGDEPFQFYKKFENVVISVDANRRHGITKLIAKEQPDVILLDDAYQHRKVKAGYSILLTAYNNLYCDDIVLPTGNLREPKSGAKRADAIIVTKCPLSITSSEKELILKKIKALPRQHVYFSSIKYAKYIYNEGEAFLLNSLKEKQVTLVTGIANPTPLLDYLKSNALEFEHLNFKDHHVFSLSEIKALKQKAFILTTEKDYMRLYPYFEGEKHLFYLPIEFVIDSPKRFENTIRNFISSA